MARDNMFHDGETKPGAAFGPALAGIDPVETFGQPRQMFGRDPGAMVADDQNTLVRRKPHARLACSGPFLARRFDAGAILLARQQGFF